MLGMLIGCKLFCLNPFVGLNVRTQRPTHLPLATVELRYKVFKTLVEENQTLIYHFQTTS